jgi:hypothetical protein
VNTTKLHKIKDTLTHTHTKKKKKKKEGIISTFY